MLSAKNYTYAPSPWRELPVNAGDIPRNDLYPQEGSLKFGDLVYTQDPYYTKPLLYFIGERGVLLDNPDYMRRGTVCVPEAISRHLPNPLEYYQDFTEDYGGLICLEPNHLMVIKRWGQELPEMCRILVYQPPHKQKVRYWLRHQEDSPRCNASYHDVSGFEADCCLALLETWEDDWGAEETRRRRVV